MSTNDVPGAVVHNNDKLSAGNWAEHEDGSMLYVMDIDENDIVIFKMYDLSDASVPTYYDMALSQREFEKTFSYDAKASDSSLSKIKWTWHDKTKMDWSRVMKYVEKPVPMPVNPEDQISAAARVARSLRTHMGRVISAEHLDDIQGIERRSGGNAAKSIFQKLKNAMNELVH